MAQQINLCTPLFLAPRRYFTARTMVQAFGVFLVVGGALAAAWTWNLTQVTAEFQLRIAVSQREIDRLKAALTLARAETAPPDTALVQEMERVRDQLRQRERVLRSLRSGLLVEDTGHAARMRLIAQTIPPQVWITGMRIDERQLELGGYTLEPAKLNEWMARLGHSQLLHGQQLAAVKVERAQGGQGGGAAVAAWAYTLVTRMPALPQEAKP